MQSSKEYYRPVSDEMIILASSSPRRRQLLEIVRVPFKVISPQIMEEKFQGESPREYVARLARAKATEVGKKVKDRWILGADTIVLIDGEVLGKPRNEKRLIQC